MEQLRTALEWMQKHHFWLLSGLAVLLVLFGWYSGTSTLLAGYNENKSTIKRTFDSVQTYQRKEFHPNGNVNEEQQKEIDKLREEVKQTWNTLYSRQREEALQWPSQLSPKFISGIDRIPFGRDQSDDGRLNFTSQMKEEYSTYIKGRFDDLPKIIDANKLDANATAEGFGGMGDFGGVGGEAGYPPMGDFGGGGEFGGGRGGFGSQEEEEVREYTVNWADQVLLREQLTWRQTGSHWMIWKTQEDLWVYETMLRAIAATNEAKGADRYANAAIRSVFAMQVGQPAAQFSRGRGRVAQFESLSTGEDEFGENDGYSQEDPYGDYGEGGGEAYDEFGELGEGGEETSEKALYFSRRYIDAEGKPITVPADSEPLDLTMFGTEYKRLPMRMHLEMDQRWVPFLITQLANAPLQIEIQEVRIDPEDASNSNGMGPMMDGGGRGMEGGVGSRFGAGFGSSEGESYRAFSRKPNMKQVVLQGVVYIFNQPDASKLAPEADEFANNTF